VLRPTPSAQGDLAHDHAPRRAWPAQRQKRDVALFEPGDQVDEVVQAAAEAG
jgi:hypothetical protein